jgi:glycine/serine hydroxymethyltransferase
MRDTIDMARESGLIASSSYLMPYNHVLQGIKAFEALVRADEREASLDAVLQAIKELRPALVLAAFSNRDKAWAIDKLKESVEKLKEKN